MNVTFVQATLAGVIVTLSLTHGATAAPPAVQTVPLPGRSFPTEKELAKFLEPLPPPAIPDDPPPHEGAMYDYPLTVAPPDLVLIEVLESLPGRPISGERLVRPDGTINLGFYGDIYVRGLTPEQIKVKVILHLRTFLPDETLGLYRIKDAGQGVGEMEKQPEAPAAELPPIPRDDDRVPPIPRDDDRVSPKSPAAATSRPAPRSSSGRRTYRVSQRAETRGPKHLTIPADQKAQNPPGQAGADEKSKHPTLHMGPLDPPPQGVEAVAVSIHPADSDRVLVDISAYNHDNYFVQGDVAIPGRMPFTGHETVLDAINHAGGFIATAEPKDIRLNRPSHGGRPARTYRVDYEAILAGDPKANYQVFPGDRLIVGRNHVVQKTIELDRLTASFENVMNSVMKYNFMVGTMKYVGDPSKGTAAISAEQREAVMKAWIDFWAKAMSQPGGVTFDEKTLREALMKAFTPYPMPKPEGKD